MQCQKWQINRFVLFLLNWYLKLANIFFNGGGWDSFAYIWIDLYSFIYYIITVIHMYLQNPFRFSDASGCDKDIMNLIQKYL